jgi:hypothetical protein
MCDNNYQANTKQAGKDLELLTNLILLDPQYDKVSNVLHLDYPLHYQSDYQIMNLLKEVKSINVIKVKEMTKKLFKGITKIEHLEYLLGRGKG